MVEGTQHFADYVEAVSWAQDYALLNRREMMRLIVEALKTVLPPFELTKEAINCHHNYTPKKRILAKTSISPVKVPLAHSKVC